MPFAIAAVLLGSVLLLALADEARGRDALIAD
jgi:hypothetical protein